MSELNYELAPRPGITASQRKAELDAARFVAVRNLAYMQYKKPDGSALMTYQETLEDRERVKAVVIQYEIAQNLVVNDGGVALTGVPTNGTHMQPVQQYAAPQGMAVAPGVGQPQAAPQAAYAAPGMAPMASPQQAVQAAAGGPPQQGEPEQVPATGRKRRGARGLAQPGQGAAVAPPPLDNQMPFPAQQMGPIPGAQAIAPSFGQPPPPIAAPGLSGSAYVASAPVDLSTVLARLDDLGRGLTAISKDLDEVAQKQVLDGSLLAKIHADTLQAFAALHHIYGSTPNLTQALQQEKVQTLDHFRAYLTPKFTGNP